MSEPVRGLILAHASVAASLVGAVRQIAGSEAESLRPLSNDGCGPDALLEAIRRDAGEGPALIFTDLASGSCAFAARKLILERPETAILSGANLAMLLDFVFHRDLALPILVDRLVARGRDAITGKCSEECTDAPGTAAG